MVEFHLPDVTSHVLIPGACLLGIVFAVVLWQRVSKIQVAGGQVLRDREYLLEEQRGDEEVRDRVSTLSSRDRGCGRPLAFRSGDGPQCNWAPPRAPGRADPGSLPR